MIMTNNWTNEKRTAKRQEMRSNRLFLCYVCDAAKKCKFSSSCRRTTKKFVATATNVAIVIGVNRLQ